MFSVKSINQIFVGLMQNDNIINETDQPFFTIICMDLRYAYKYEVNKREIKIGEEKK